MKYVRHRDTRHRTGRPGEIEGLKLSCVIHADSPEEANEIFEERWKQKMAGKEEASAQTLPLITTEAISASAMTPAALAIKRNTIGVKP